MNRLLLRTSLLSAFLVLIVTYSALATHLRAGEITVRRDACNSLRFWITVTVFTNTINTNVLFGGEDDWLDFGDGTRMLVPETPNTQRPDLGDGIATASFTIDHTYSGFQRYIISYSEPNRNAGVLNMDASVNTRFYIETEITLDPFLGCNQYTPVLEVPPIDRGCTGVAWSHNPGAYDLDGDSLSYVMVVPFRERNTTVVNYRDPNNASFYPNFGAGNEQGNGQPTFAINPVTGTITWDAPGAGGQGEYNIAFEILEWRKIRGVWIRLGKVRRDMQIIIDECDNERPDLIVPEDVCVEAGTTLNAEILGIDPDNDPVKIEAFSEIFELAPAQSPATYTPNPATFQTPLPAKLQFQWKTECIHVKEQSYQVVLKVTDDPPNGPSLVTFKTWNIKVVGPRPIWQSANVNYSNRSADLRWENYLCQNAETMQVWRRVDKYEFQPDECQTGMPEGLGYSLIAQLPIKNANGTPVNSFNDNNGGRGLASGAVYCYRLVAIFPAPRGGESYVSEEICLPPIRADEPIITNVTVDRTGDIDGQITVAWVEPFEADPAQFPPPYTYNIFRAENFEGNTNQVRINPSPVSATTIVDNGLNTRNRVYNYTVVAIAANGSEVGTSASASSVRLEAQSRPNAIQLNWNAIVPWSNQVPGLTHRIYRSSTAATTPSQLTLLAEVDITQQGLAFTDEGQPGAPLQAGQEYCYVVETYGKYGSDNDLITSKEPLRNYSQIVCAIRGDEVPPCTPDLPVAASAVDCEQYLSNPATCNNGLFSNTVTWSRPNDPDCEGDVSFYRIWVSSVKGGEFVQLPVEVRDTFYIDNNLPSFARCYRIQAVDRSGNASEPSEEICFDNCPYYELPNVFTPNKDGCNDVFRAYSNNDPFLTRDESTGQITLQCGGTSDQSKCARFVLAVDLKIYNRWGREVYTYRSGGERTIFVDWDGRSNDGTELSSGIYYYVADVSFISVDPEKQSQTIKGWVHLMR